MISGMLDRNELAIVRSVVYASLFDYPLSLAMQKQPGQFWSLWSTLYASGGELFDDANAPERFAPLPPAPTHSSEIHYLFDEPNAPALRGQRSTPAGTSPPSRHRSRRPRAASPPND